MPLRLYRPQYLAPTKGRRKSSFSSLLSAGTESTEEETVDVAFIKSKESVKMEVEESDAVALPVDPELAEVDSEDEQQVFSDNPGDMCWPGCNICKDPVKVLRAHVQKHHQDISFREFRKIYPEEIQAFKNYHRLVLN